MIATNGFEGKDYIRGEEYIIDEVLASQLAGSYEVVEEIKEKTKEVEKPMVDKMIKSPKVKK